MAQKLCFGLHPVPTCFYAAHDESAWPCDKLFDILTWVFNSLVYPRAHDLKRLQNMGLATGGGAVAIASHSWIYPDIIDVDAFAKHNHQRLFSFNRFSFDETKENLCVEQHPLGRLGALAPNTMVSCFSFCTLSC